MHCSSAGAPSRGAGFCIHRKRDVADACLARYTKETGKAHGIASDKIALEIRLHDNIYTLLLMMGITEEHTRVTDIMPTEGNIFQKGIDALYWLGVK